MYTGNWCDDFDCKKRSKIKPEASLLACVKVSSFGVSFSTFYNYFQMEESSVSKAGSRLSHGVAQNEEISQMF